MWEHFKLSTSECHSDPTGWCYKQIEAQKMNEFWEATGLTHDTVGSASQVCSCFEVGTGRVAKESSSLPRYRVFSTCTYALRRTDVTVYILDSNFFISNSQFFFKTLEVWLRMQAHTWVSARWALNIVLDAHARGPSEDPTIFNTFKSHVIFLQDWNVYFGSTWGGGRGSVA